jgi:hypothetical protein
VARVEGVNRILVRGVNWVGDTVLSYPAVEGIRNLFPKAHLAGSCSGVPGRFVEDRPLCG